MTYWSDESWIRTNKIGAWARGFISRIFALFLVSGRRNHHINRADWLLVGFVSRPFNRAGAATSVLKSGPLAQRYCAT
jgi:hypothetical protein